MKDSVTYQAIIEEGKIEARHEGLLRLGRKRFGQALKAIRDLDRLDRLVDRLLEASSWEQFLATP
jgi:hypothetical protein